MPLTQEVITQLSKHIESIFSPDGWLVQQGLYHIDEQADFARYVVKLLSSESSKEVMGLFQGDTGIGKTLAYLFPAAVFSALTGKPSLISTYTIALQNQILESDWLLVKHWFVDKGIPVPSIAQRLGKQNFISPSRVERYIHVYFDGSPVPEAWTTLQEWAIKSCRTGSGLIQDYINAYGRLPEGALQEEICINEDVTDDITDNPQYRAHLERASIADITLTSHQMLILEGMLAYSAPS